MTDKESPSPPQGEGADSVGLVLIFTAFFAARESLYSTTLVGSPLKNNLGICFTTLLEPMLLFNCMLRVRHASQGVRRRQNPAPSLAAFIGCCSMPLATNFLCSTEGGRPADISVDQRRDFQKEREMHGLREKNL